jgi:hypothetical protein
VVIGHFRTVNLHILKKCVGVTKIELIDTISLSSLADLRPTHISGVLQRIVSHHPGRTLYLPFFANTTHLELRESLWLSRNYPFGSLPCLTHLAFTEFDTVAYEWDEDGLLLAALQDILGTCRGLRMVLILVAVSEDIAMVKVALGGVSSRIIFAGIMQDPDTKWANHVMGEDVWTGANPLLVQVSR